MAKNLVRAAGDYAIHLSEGFRHHKGCRKAAVHAAFVKEGHDAAFALAEKLDIRPSSAAAWLSTFKRDVGDCQSYRLERHANAERLAKMRAKRLAKKTAAE